MPVMSKDTGIGTTSDMSGAMLVRVSDANDTQMMIVRIFYCETQVKMYQRC